MKKRTYGNNGAATCGSRVRSAADDVLAGEEPVAPAEAANVVQSAKEKNGSLRVLHSVVLNADLFGLLPDVCQELAMGKRAISTELMKDFSEWGFGHGNFAEVVEQRDLIMLDYNIFMDVGWRDSRCCHLHHSHHGS